MNDLRTKSLAQIVNCNHRAATVFEKYHLDFCCKGKRTLQQACVESELHVDDILAELNKPDQQGTDKVTINFGNLSFTQLVEYIVSTHHEYVKKEMPAITMYLEKIVSKKTKAKIYKTSETIPRSI